MSYPDPPANEQPFDPNRPVPQPPPGWSSPAGYQPGGTPGQPVPPGYAGFPRPVAPPRKNTGKIVLAVVGGLVGLCCIGAVAAVVDGATKDNAAAKTATSAVATTAATKQATTEPSAPATTRAVADATPKADADATPRAVADATPKVVAGPTPKAVPKLTVAQENAVEKAADYLDYGAFSRSGLIKQLKFEGFSTEDATFGVDAQKADWNEQAAKKAQEYLDYSSFSRSGLIQQLKFEGFTTAQATYGVKKAGL